MPQPERGDAAVAALVPVLLTRFLVISFIAGGAVPIGPATAQESSGDYATDLGRVYGGYQRVLALKEACDSAVPETRAANDKAFAAWQAEHRDLLDELRRRVTVMIRLASKDERDYTRNLGKYEGAILQSREEHKQTLLGLGAGELGGQCRNVPGHLKSPQADLNQVYASELQTIRRRK